MQLLEVPKYGPDASEGVRGPGFGGYQVRLETSTLDCRNVDHPHILLPGLLLEKNIIRFTYSNYCRDYDPCDLFTSRSPYPKEENLFLGYLTKPVDAHRGIGLIIGIYYKDSEEVRQWLEWCLLLFGDGRLPWSEVENIINNKASHECAI